MLNERTNERMENLLSLSLSAIRNHLKTLGSFLHPVSHFTNSYSAPRSRLPAPFSLSLSLFLFLSFSLSRGYLVARSVPRRHLILWRQVHIYKKSTKKINIYICIICKYICICGDYFFLFHSILVTRCTGGRGTDRSTDSVHRSVLAR